MKLFPELEMTATELNIVAENLNNPAVQKYLQFQLYGLGEGLSGMEPKEGETTEAFLIRLAEFRGMAMLVRGLLNIERAPKSINQ